MDINSVLKTFKENDIRKIKLGIFDIDGLFRGKYISIDKFISSVESSLSFCDVLFGWDVTDSLYDQETLTGWHTGYPDAQAKIDIDSFRIIPWEKDTALFIMDFCDAHGEPYPLSPRNLLQKLIDRANELGFQVCLSAEYEFFLFDETSHSLQEKNFFNLKPLSPGMFGYSIVRASTNSDIVHSIIDAMESYDIEIEGIHTETGPGVYETAIRYDTGICAADKAALFKTGIKELASKQGLIATFMAKWNADLPGCSGHIHHSLWDRNTETNLFADPDSENGLSELALHFIAGQLKLMPSMTALACPTINSYKRTVPGLWSPTNVSWGIDNRTTAIRAIPSTSKTTRVEYRLSGADANPYLAMAAGLASGLYGIENCLEPPSPISDNAYKDETLLPLPNNLADATECLSRSKTARQYLGDIFVDHYVMTRNHEVRCYERSVTDWELQRYFEAI